MAEILLAQSLLPATKMWRISCSTFCTLLILVSVHRARAHRSFRIAAMIRGIDANDTSPETVGGSSHDCYRTCVAGDVRTCVYSFTLMEYTTMSSLCGDCPHTRQDCYKNGCITAGGEVRQVSVVNRMLPGPSIQVCEGDTVQVDVINAFPSETATIHWHGLHQVGTPYMDGVPHLTQCPIDPNNKFKYNFTANPAGTHMWHSHSGFQEADGVSGSFVVRVADDPLSQYYDYDLAEHIMTIWHWFGTTSGFVFRAMPPRGMRIIDGHSLIINGLAATLKYEKDDAILTTPRAEFTVTQGYRYRFRSLSNTAVYCPVQVSIDNHTMLVIASDGASFEPVLVDSFVINAGERYDFVLSADQEVGNYWIRYRGFGDCAFDRGTVSGEAILRYLGANDTDPPGAIGFDNPQRSGVLLSPVEEFSTNYSKNSLIRLTELNGTMSVKPNVSGTPDHIIYLEETYHVYNEFHPPMHFLPQFNNVSFEFPPIPFLTQYEDITSDMFCTKDDETAKDCVGTYCTCPYVYSVEVGSLVEMVIVDTNFDDYHPLHLHGQYFQIVAMEAGNRSTTADEVKVLNEAGLIKKKLDGGPLKDTVGIPDHGFAVLRFVANNPGYWFFHCHVTKHLDRGMAIVIKIGKHSEMVKRPVNFPTCGNYDVTDASPQAT